MIHVSWRDTDTMARNVREIKRTHQEYGRAATSDVMWVIHNEDFTHIPQRRPLSLSVSLSRLHKISLYVHASRILSLTASSHLPRPLFCLH